MSLRSSHRRCDHLLNRLKGKHTHWRNINSTIKADWPYLRSLQEVPLFDGLSYEQLMHHPETGVYWAMYAEDKWCDYEPITAEQAQHIKNDPSLLKSYRKKFMESPR